MMKTKMMMMKSMMGLMVVLSACATGMTFEQMKTRSSDVAKAAAAGEMSCTDLNVEQSGGGERSREFTARGCGKVLQLQTTCDEKDCSVASTKDMTPAAPVAATPPAATTPAPAPAATVPATTTPAPNASAVIFTGKMASKEAWRNKLIELASNEMTCPMDKLTVTAPAAGVEGVHKIEGCSKFVQYSLDCGDDGACAVLRS
jgi:hypothetical protein